MLKSITYKKYTVSEKLILHTVNTVIKFYNTIILCRIAAD